MRDLIASNAPLRNGMHKARQNGPNHYPQGIQGDRNPLGTPFSSIFRRATKDGVPEGRWYRSAVSKKMESTFSPRVICHAQQWVNIMHSR